MFAAALDPSPAPTALPLAGAKALPPRPAAAPSGEAAPPAVWQWLAAALDELDYGIVLLSDALRIIHINEAAQTELDDDHPLQMVGNELHARLARDVAPLHEALAAAATRRLRRLLTVGEASHRMSASIVPLDAANAGPRAVLVVLGKRELCESLSIQGFARGCGLTHAETRVLAALCSGVPPTEVAKQQGVAVSTVRSQIGSLRQKTGAASIRALVRQLAVLPPMKEVLRRNGVARQVPVFAPALSAR
ncbi:MAG TPA: helix-turn-helix transcriptional regulator [Caldimonas sp.]